MPFRDAYIISLQLHLTLPNSESPIKEFVVCIYFSGKLINRVYKVRGQKSELEVGILASFCSIPVGLFSELFCAVGSGLFFFFFQGGLVGLFFNL